MGRFELGMFDPADMLPWAKLGADVIAQREEPNLMAVDAAPVNGTAGEQGWYPATLKEHQNTGCAWS